MKTYHKNPRSITEEQTSNLAEWINELGDISGIVHNNNTDEIISGNQRSEVIEIDKCEIEIYKKFDPVSPQGTIEEGQVITKEGVRLNYRLVDWTPEQCEKANIIANKAGGTWDWEVLETEFDKDDLIEWGFDESEFGIGVDEAEVTTGDDDVPEVQEQSETVKGDLWELGNHRLLCGDSTLIDDVEKLMGGEKADMVFTDPPYGVDYDGGHASKKRREKLKNDDDVNMYDLPIKNSYWASTDSAPIYLWFADRFANSVIDGVESAGYSIRSWVIWNKNVAQFGAIGAQYKSKHEPCIYAFKKGKKVNWCGPNNEVTVWDISRDHKNRHHRQWSPQPHQHQSTSQHHQSKCYRHITTYGYPTPKDHP